MISSPLFIIVAESTVILGPIDQLGWCSASATVTRPRGSSGRSRNGPPLAGSNRGGTPRGVRADHGADPLEVLRVAGDEVARLAADRAGRAEQDDAAAGAGQGCLVSWADWAVPKWVPLQYRRGSSGGRPGWAGHGSPVIAT